MNARGLLAPGEEPEAARKLLGVAEKIRKDAIASIIAEVERMSSFYSGCYTSHGSWSSMCKSKCAPAGMKIIYTLSQAIAFVSAVAGADVDKYVKRIRERGEKIAADKKALRREMCKLDGGSPRIGALSMFGGCV